MICPRCGLTLTYERDPDGKFTRLFSVGQNGTMFCPPGVYREDGSPGAHIAPTGLKKIWLKLQSRLNEWEV